MISVGHKEGMVEEHEAKLLDRVFDFGDRPAHEVMVPRLEVAGLSHDATIADFMKLYAESPMSRFPVFRESMDNVVGVLAVKALDLGLPRHACPARGDPGHGPEPARRRVRGLAPSIGVRTGGAIPVRAAAGVF